MKNPVLVILAAGMGSRYGGLKQIDPMDEWGHLIIDFSLYDAKRAGFEKVIFIIKKEMEEEFKEVIGKRMEQQMEVSYAFQDIHALPSGFRLPTDRSKPWGTAHALLSTIEQIDGPFAVINADDYYGLNAFQSLYDHLKSMHDDEKYRYSMVAYRLKNTVTEHGSVARGICEMTTDDRLISVTERTKIEKKENYIAYSEDDGKTWTELDGDTLVSMNMWGFSPSILQEIKDRFPAFLQTAAVINPLKSEFYLPSVVSELLQEEKASVTVLQSKDQWYGVTYREDKEMVVKAIRQMKKEGIYPEKLWEDA